MHSQGWSSFCPRFFLISSNNCLLNFSPAKLGKVSKTSTSSDLWRISTEIFDWIKFAKETGKLHSKWLIIIASSSSAGFSTSIWSWIAGGISLARQHHIYFNYDGFHWNVMYLLSRGESGVSIGSKFFFLSK